MVSKGSKKDDILQKINKFSIDDASNLDKLRVILESIQREYILNYSHIIYIFCKFYAEQQFPLKNMNYLLNILLEFE